MRTDSRTSARAGNWSTIPCKDDRDADNYETLTAKVRWGQLGCADA